ncbi:MAG TPA: cytochrome c oxidase assembly protein [Steroidobacteraceae bacterium]|nr:cytochrome c oxidase assembly protein [Steroidobacteraceae bacterium]
MPRLIVPALASTLLVCAGAQAHDIGTVATLRWTLDAWVTLPLVLSLLWFGVGTWRLRRRSSQPRGHRTATLWFAAGWLVLALALVTPLHAAGERSFAAHMLEHELLMLVAAPMLVMSRPVGRWLWALPHAVRLRLARWGCSRPVARSWRAVTDPWCATALQAAALWGWHAPPAFDLALASSGWHVVQHLCFLVSALLFWWAMLQGRGRRRVVVAAACLFVTSILSGALGALMALSSGPWYAGYAALGLQPFGLSAAEDQQLAGLLMWVPGGLVHAVFGVALLTSLLRDEPRRQPARLSAGT